MEKTNKLVKILIAIIVILLFVIIFLLRSESADKSIARKAYDSQTPASCWKIKNNQAQIECENSANFLLASQKQDESICEKITDDRKQSCKESIILAQARENMDLSLCDKLDIENKEICVGEVELLILNSQFEVPVFEEDQEDVSFEDACEILETEKEVQECKENL